MKIWSWALVAVLALASFESEAARRLGGGGSVGRQSGNVTQREAAKPNQAAPAQNQNQAAPAAQPGANPAAAAPKRPWGAMLGGLAAGLGLAWLANSLGLGEAFGQFLMFALLAMVVMVVIGFIMRSRRNAQPNRPLAFQGAGAPADQAMPPRQYSPDNVGNDASARPWERNSHGLRCRQARRQGQPAVQIGSALAGSQTLGRARGLRHRRLPGRGQAQLRHPAGRLGPRRHRDPALDDDRRNAGRDQVAAGRARKAHWAASRTRPRW